MDGNGTGRNERRVIFYSWSWSRFGHIDESKRSLLAEIGKGALGMANWLRFRRVI